MHRNRKYGEEDKDRLFGPYSTPKRIWHFSSLPENRGRGAMLVDNPE
jgi:hypothetical protein